jgi:serine/threonine-protein phosphatase PP1 catalytic subunit
LSGDASSISLDKTDSQSIKSSTSGKSSQRHRASTSISESNGRRDSDEGDEDQEVPPSPTQSASVLAGHNDSQLEDAKRSGEVDAVSDAPPQGHGHISGNTEPTESILQKKLPNANALPSQGAAGALAIAELSLNERVNASSSNMDIGTLKTADLDDMIKRLVDAGYAGKVTKTVCLKKKMCVEESGSEDRSVGGRNRLVQVVFWRCPLSQPSSNIDSNSVSSDER